MMDEHEKRELVSAFKECIQEHCSFSDAERKWVHSAAENIEMKHLSVAGRLLKMFDDTSTMVGRAIMLALIFGGMAGVLGYIAIKFYSMAK